MYFSHMGVPLRKSTYDRAWEKYASIKKTCMNRFRMPMDVFHFMVTAEDIFLGSFIPISPKNIGKCINLDEFDRIEKAFGEKKHMMVCFNDSDAYTDEMEAVINMKVDDVLSKIFAEKSTFEL